MGIIDIVIRQQREIAVLRAENIKLHQCVSEMRTTTAGFRNALNVAWAIITHQVQKQEKKD